MNMNQNLRQLALEVAATCFHDNVALQSQIGTLRTVSGWWCGQSGLDLETAKGTTETLVSLVLDQVIELRAGSEVQA